MEEAIKSDIIEYLTKLSTFFADRPSGYSKVLASGKSFIPAKRPKGLRKKADKLCYMNAGRLALDDESLIYCEGFAKSEIGFITEHAWCITSEGVVIDPTWKNPEKCEYFGIPFKLEYLREVTLRTAYWGIISHTNVSFYSKEASEYVQELPLFEQ